MGRTSTKWVCVLTTAAGLAFTETTCDGLLLRQKLKKKVCEGSCGCDGGGRAADAFKKKNAGGGGGAPVGGSKAPANANNINDPCGGGPVLRTASANGLPSLITKEACGMVLPTHRVTSKLPHDAVWKPYMINVNEYYQKESGSRSGERQGGAIKKMMSHYRPLHRKAAPHANVPDAPIIWLLGDSIFDSADYMAESGGGAAGAARGVLTAQDWFTKLPRTDLIRNYKHSFWFWHPFQMPDVPYWLNKNIREGNRMLQKLGAGRGKTPIGVNAAMAGSILGDRGSAKNTIRNENEMRVRPDDVFVISVGNNDMYRKRANGQPSVVQRVLDNFELTMKGGVKSSGLRDILKDLALRGGDTNAVAKKIAEEIIKEFTTHLWPDHLHPWLESLCVKNVPRKILMLSLPLFAPFYYRTQMKIGNLIPSSVFEDLNMELSKKSVVELKNFLTKFQATHKAFANVEFDVLDFSLAMPGMTAADALYNKDGLHPNWRGNKALADLIYTKLGAKKK